MRWFVLGAPILGAYVLGPFCGMSLSALAADLDVHSKIDAVTIFPNIALVSRIAEVDLPAGQTSLVFKNLPINLDPASLRVSGQGAGKLTLGPVASRLTRAEPKPDNAIEARLKELRSEREGWQVTLEALEAEKAMMLRFSKAGPEKLAPDSKPLEVGQWTKAWETVGAGLAKLGDELRSARGRLRDLDEAILAIEATRARPAVKPEPAREVTVEIDSPAATPARVALAYRIAGANWRPRYEARLQTGGGKTEPSLDFTRRAAISQTTGEDWSDVALTVSTIRTDKSVGAPDLAPQRIGFIEDPLAAAGTARPAAKSEPARRPRGPSELASAPPAPARDGLERRALEQEATIDSGAYAAAFEIAGRVSLSADGTVKTAPISSRKLTPNLSVKTVPARDPTAYLVSRFANDNEAPLLPGEVALYRDGSYLGSGEIDFVAAGDSFDLSFGADERVKVTRAPVRRKENEPTWYGQTKSEIREFKTSIENMHDFPLKIALIDAVPFSENTAISVELLPATTPPSEKSVADKRGVMSWTYEYAPGEKRDIRLAYKMKWPADREIAIEPAPFAPR